MLIEADHVLALVKRVLWGTIRRFGRDHILVMSASLAYTTVLSIVPVATIAFGLFSAFPSYTRIMTRARQLILSTFVPGVSGPIEQQLDTFIANATALPLFGVGALLVTATLLVIEVETAFNYIWKPRTRRPWNVRILEIWAAVTGMPILAVASAWAIGEMIDVAGGALGDISGSLILLGFEAVAFFFMYITLPSYPVPKLPALIGALVAASLVHLARIGFALYVAHSALQSAIYGALATIPLLLVWIFILWAVILFGAALAAEIEIALAAHRTVLVPASALDRESPPL